MSMKKTVLDNQWDTEDTEQSFFKLLEWGENEDTNFQNLWEIVEAALQQRFLDTAASE